MNDPASVFVSTVILAFGGDFAALGDEDLARRIDHFLTPAITAGHLSGSLLVAHGDTILVERCFGLADLEHAVPITPKTRFVIASITKEMTFALALRLAERRMIDLNDPLAKYAPDFPRGDRITILHLMQHRAGIPHRVTEDHQETRPRTAADMLEFAVVAKQLDVEPGSKSVYSSAGYSVLARVLEIASGRPFEQLLTDHVFQPAGLENTLDANAREIVPDRAESSFLGPAGVEHAPLKDLSFLVGAGSALSTPRDLHRLQRAILDGVLGESVRLSAKASGNLDWYGSSNGYVAFADHDEATDFHFVFCSNRATGAIAQLRRALPLIAAGESLESLAVPDVEGSDIPVGRFTESLGRYRDERGMEFELCARGERLFAGDVPLVVRKDESIFAPFDYGELTFDRAPGIDSRVERLIWKSPTYTTVFERVTDG